jgi:oxygen-dependent protoporphyrinogen oxidase
VRLEGGGELLADRVVLATSAPVAAAMLVRQAPELARTLASFPQAGLAVVAFAFRAEDLARPLDGYGYLVSREARLDTLGVVWESSLFEGRAPAGHVLLRVMLGGARRPEVAALAEAEIVRRAQRELGDVLGIVAPPARTWTWRWPQAITQYTQGHLERVARARAAAALHAGLELCGTSYDGISFTSAIVSAERAAGRVLAASTPGARAEVPPDASVAPLPPSAHGARAESAGVR